jgi:phytoene desaturase
MEMMRAQIARIDARDVDGFDRFLRASKSIFEVAFAELADQPFHGIGTLLSAAPDLLRLGGFRSVHAEVCRYFKSEKLRLLFSFHPLLIGGNPFTTTAYYCLIAHLERTYGVHYAMGGTGSLVRGLTDLIAGQGGELRCNAEVTEILVKGGRACGVRLADGSVLQSDIVVSNADAAWTYSKLLAHHPRRRWTDRRLARARYSMSLFVWYFGTNRRYDSVYHHMMVLGPRYRELLRDIFDRKVLAEDFSLYLHRPSATDPSVAPAGCDSFYVLAPVPNLKSGTVWQSQAESYRARIERRLEETVLPGLGQAIVSSRYLTPLDFQNRLSSVNGAAFALEPQLFQSAWFRPHNRSEEVTGLYLVGAGTHPGAGLPGVLSSARVLDKIVV